MDSNSSIRYPSDRPTPRPQPKSTIPAKRSAADAQEDAWVADEDRFVLKQAKKKALIRTRGGRADPIDLLAVTLRALDATKTGFDSDDEDEEIPMVDPEGVLEGLNDAELTELDRGIDTYLALEHSRSNREFWNTMKIICKDRRQALNGKSRSARGMSSVSTDLDRLLGPKNYEQLETLERQVKQKLRSNEPIDVDYWENLLKSLSIYKAKASLRKVSQSVLGARLDILRKQQEQEASLVCTRICDIAGAPAQAGDRSMSGDLGASAGNEKTAGYDPEPLLRLGPEEKSFASIEEVEFLAKLAQDRRKVLKLGYIPARQGAFTKNTDTTSLSIQRQSVTSKHDDVSRATSALYEREAARGFNDNEEAFAAEEDVSSTKPKWADKYRPRKPKYFNRVQMGYEWNKYNQTHYDHDNPPPKVVQGYKFNIFYPDLIDTTKAPTFRIERENGRKRGQTFAVAGEEDTCLIRFIAGPPYEDIAFRVQDREWDYSAKRDRGFRSSFDKGILQLHFGFKKLPQPYFSRESPLRYPNTGEVGRNLYPSIDVQHYGLSAGQCFQAAQDAAPSYEIEEQLRHLVEASPISFTPESLPSSLPPSAFIKQQRISPSSPHSITWPTDTLNAYQFRSNFGNLDSKLPELEYSSPTSLDVGPTFHQDTKTTFAEIERTGCADETVPLRHHPDSTEIDADSADPCYAELLRQCLMDAPGHTMSLRDLYEWVQKHSSKAKDPSSKGWMNSVRHNLSMNQGFEKADRSTGSTSHPSKKGSHWRLTKEAIEHGIKSTTRYRKDNKRKSPHSSAPFFKRQVSGAKGGQATRRAAKHRRAAATADASTIVVSLPRHDLPRDVTAQYPFVPSRASENYGASSLVTPPYTVPAARDLPSVSVPGSLLGDPYSSYEWAYQPPSTMNSFGGFDWYDQGQG
ncbi:hypothetical protein MBLNU459_g1351t1 [Dothideomycetes sp. NU459]